MPRLVSVVQGANKMRNAYNQNGQQQQIRGIIAGLMNDLQKLAPHPDQPQNNGPLFIKCDPSMKAANDHDGMLGSMMMESLLGTAFADAVSECLGSGSQEIVEDLDLTNALECYSAYITDIEQDKEDAAAHGQGTLARLSGKSISNSFNMRTTMQSGMQSFLDDLPSRMTIERNLAYYAKKLNTLEATPEVYEAPRYAA